MTIGTVAPQGTAPAATYNPEGVLGGESMPMAVSSISNLRTIVDRLQTRALLLNAENVFDIPNLGYSKAYRIFVRGTLTVTIPTGGSVTPGNPRRLFRQIAYMMQSNVRIFELPGVELDLLNNLDFKRTPNKNVFTVNAGDNPFYQEYVVYLPYSEERLGGIIYKGGGSTQATLRLLTGGVTDILALAGGATATFSSLNVDIREDRIDGPAPVNPRERPIIVDGKQQMQYIPGEGFWQETSRFIERQIDQEIRDIAGPNREINVEMQRTQPYLRVILLSYINNQLDATDSLVSGFRTEFENTTRIQNFTLDDSDRRFREMFGVQRPGGVHVLSFRDLVESDRDTLYTDKLGRFQIIATTGPNAPATNNPNSFLRVVVERVKMLDRAAAY